LAEFPVRYCWLSTINNITSLRRGTLLSDFTHQRYALIKEPNEVRILRLVRDSGEISRIEIARSTNLHKASVTDYVVKLIKAGYLEETGKVAAKSKAGRKRILLKFRPLSGLVAGVDIRMTSAIVAITDLNARILQQDSLQYSVDTSPQEVLSKVASTIEKLLAAGKYSESRLVGIGVGVQGVIDYATNIMVLSHNKQSWQGESLSKYLESYFDVPVYVENDVKAMAVGEYLLGAAKGTKDFVLIWVGTGLGAGIMINGHLHHGITSSAGEIGYNGLEFSAVEKERFPLTYKGQAMFGEILTDANFIECYQHSTQQLNRGKITVTDICMAAMKGDHTATQIIEEFAALLNILCINLVNMLNPEMIVIGGELAQSHPQIAEMLQQKIHKDLLLPPAEAVRVRSAKHGESGVILGAVGLVLYELFEPLRSLSVRTPRRQSFLGALGTD
jgi:N-acetylglucosamine repressor